MVRTKETVKSSTVKQGAGKKPHAMKAPRNSNQMEKDSGNSGKENEESIANHPLPKKVPAKNPHYSAKIPKVNFKII
jgi:hypothetical protein